MSRRSRRAVAATAALGTAVTVAAAAACSGTPRAPAPDPRVAGYCAALRAGLPREVAGLARSAPGPGATAAWGKSITLRCGVPRPAEDADENTDALEMGGVGWSFARMPDGSARLTTTLRLAYVEVTLRGDFSHDPSPLFALAGPIKDTVPEGIAG